MIADDARPMFDKEAKERLKTSTGGSKPQPVEKVPQVEQGKSRDKVGEVFDISGKLVDDARNIKEKAPELAEEVRKGDKTISQAKRELKKAEVSENMAELQDSNNLFQPKLSWRFRLDTEKRIYFHE